jgi:hypothetical protein
LPADDGVGLLEGDGVSLPADDGVGLLEGDGVGLPADDGVGLPEDGGMTRRFATPRSGPAPARP